ncbi:hypothetical protein [Vibrio taketomensis]|uniref:hypothetical protein n=1 Tax=Vibrio taketomensis TaxID=2572923 RepID=UPI00138993F0|nr:hypothetical protein [Vibrio taketomensis]
MKKIITLSLISLLSGCSVVRQIGEIPSCDTREIDSTKQQLEFMLSVSPSSCFDSVNIDLSKHRYTAAQIQQQINSCNVAMMPMLTSHDQDILDHGFIEQMKQLAHLYQTQYQELTKEHQDCAEHDLRAYRDFNAWIPSIIKRADKLERHNQLVEEKRLEYKNELEKEAKKQKIIEENKRRVSADIAARQQYYQSLPQLHKTNGNLLYAITDVELNHHVASSCFTLPSIETVIDVKVTNLSTDKGELVNWSNVNKFGSQKEGYMHVYATRARLSDEQGKNLDVRGGAEFKNLAPGQSFTTSLRTDQVIDSSTLNLSIPVGFAQFIDFNIPLKK